MDLFNQLFSKDIKEAQDFQSKIEHNETLQKHCKTKMSIIGIAKKELLYEEEHEHLRSEENRLAKELSNLVEDNKKLQDNFRISNNIVKVLQNATEKYENNN